MSDSPSIETMDLVSLFAAAKSGDSRAHDILVRRLYPKVERLVHARLAKQLRREHPWIRNLFSTGDVVQDVFLGLLCSASVVADQGENSMVRYLAATVHNRLMDMLRHHRAERRDALRRAGTSELGNAEPEQPGRGGPPRAAEHRERLDAYRAVLNGFSSKYRLILRQRLELGKTFVELADELDLPSADAARKLFHYVHAKLLAKLQSRGISSSSCDDDV